MATPTDLTAFQEVKRKIEHEQVLMRGHLMVDAEPTHANRTKLGVALSMLKDLNEVLATVKPKQDGK